MKIDVISDLHLTHFKDFGTKWIADWAPQAEILILAGDVGEFHWWQQSFERIKALSEKYEHVLYIAGNHDYYGTTLQDGDAHFREIEGKLPNFHFLEQDLFEIDGVKFAGCALWFKEDSRNVLYERWMNDFYRIKQFKPAVYERDAESQEFLRELEDIDIVITHHVPSRFSVHEKYTGDPCTRFFLCEIGDVILDLQPKVWIHGHTHIPFDYRLGDTRVLCNPMGYPRENPGPYGPVTIEI